MHAEFLGVPIAGKRTDQVTSGRPFLPDELPSVIGITPYGAYIGPFLAHVQLLGHVSLQWQCRHNDRHKTREGKQTRGS